MREFNFEKLEAWQLSLRLGLDIYKITTTYPDSEIYNLTSQLRRTAVSISSNLSEGTSRFSGKGQAHFTSMSYSSLMEMLNQLIYSHELHYIQNKQYHEFRNEISILASKLNALYKAQIRNGKDKGPKS